MLKCKIILDDKFVYKGENEQQTGHCLQGLPGIIGQLRSLQEFVSSVETLPISTLLQVSSNEKTTSGNTEKHNIKTKETLNKRTCFIFISIIVKFKNILTVNNKTATNSMHIVFFNKMIATTLKQSQAPFLQIAKLS